MIESLFDRMDAWRHLPSYQLERRADLFFSLYLPEVLEAKLGFKIKPILVPEFPVRIGSIYPEDSTNKSFKIDYFALSEDGRQAVLVELKTDGLSRRTEQDDYLLAAQEAGLQVLLEGVLDIFRASTSKRKYFHLLDQLATVGLLDIPAQMYTMMEKTSPRGITAASEGISVTSGVKNHHVIYIQPQGSDDCIVSFADFREVVERHDDSISRRFARSLAEWADVQAGGRSVSIETVPQESAMEIGPQSRSDTAMTAKYRLLQSKYRAEVLKQDYGHGPGRNSKMRHGNMLINGEQTGSNFISTAAFEFAQEKVLQRQTNKYLTIEPYRLFNNMLSSQPMCFNLFSDLRKLLKEDPAEASRITKLLFEEIPWIDKLVDIDVEFIPVPIEDYTNDKSAFDAMLIVQDQEGQKGLISIETKYTDLLGGNPARDTATKNALVEQGGFFGDELKGELRKNGYKQIHRNFLLTYAYAARQGFTHFVNVVISPEEDKLSVTEIEELQQHMTQYQDRIFKIPLEAVVERGIQCGNQDIAAVMQRFKARYLSAEAE